MAGLSQTWTKVAWEWFKIRDLFEGGDFKGCYNILKETQKSYKDVD